MEQKVSDLLGNFGFLLIFLFGYQTFAVWRHHGRSPLVALTRGTLGERAQVLAAFGYPFLILSYAMWPHAFAAVPGVSALEALPFKLAGALLMALGLGTLMIAYVTLGMAWRVGIDAGGTDELVERGIYGRVRHPVYTAMMLMYLGVFLMVPNAVFFAGWAAHVAGTVRQALKEEVHLRARFGAVYDAYCARTGRFFP